MSTTDPSENGSDAQIDAQRRKVEARLGSIDPSRRGFVRADFFRLIADATSALEIGPLANPALRGPHVKYFDVMPTDELRKKAVTHDLDPNNCPEITYYSREADLSIVPDRFEAVVSSHSIEHQPDLISHLLKVGNLLDVGGCYWIACPDKRYCLDHFMRQSSIVDVLDSHGRTAQVHTVGTLVKQVAFVTHNDPIRHWKGDHGEPAYKSDASKLSLGVDLVIASNGVYIDSHAWQFVPESFLEIVELLFEIGYSVFKPVKIYDTAYGSNEFYAVLQKVRAEPLRVLAPLPADFDADLYLQANPDVARAGADAAGHYRCHGAREGRRLRPE
jgi:hypothetical protein